MLKFQQPVDEDAVRTALDAIPGEKVIQPYGDAGRQRVADPPAAEPAAEQGASLEQGAQRGASTP